MAEPKRYTAPWGKLLWAFTLLGCGILIAAPAAMILASSDPGWLAWTTAATVVLIMVGCALVAVRGYRLEDEHLIIERPLWETRVPLTGLKSVRHSTDLIKGAIRVGNGGLFVFAGWYWSRQHGWFHLAGNDIMGRCVLLDLTDRKWMITPGDPESFVTRVSALRSAPAH